ncbi:ion channel [Aestuariibacter sp. AA17]|uniref:Ion channel n=1 Tax=Fluctibacter corallii TaxID=2984329 RepID=A0ABT3A9M3_9ALTE|nr:ion channel [Aestuariibacter sp. AA17]MCV2885287.1 ion channel [Aestuariibacter sp. AA17]
MSKQCRFVSLKNTQCPLEDLGNGYCFWHDPHVDKSNMDLSKKLESHIKNGGYSIGLQLKKANLEGIDLVNTGEKQGFDLSESDLYRAKLRGAHLFNVTLSNGSLMKADLREANLHCAHLNYTNLLGTRWQDARLDNLEVGDELIQESLGRQYRKQGRVTEAMDQFEQSEEVYRQLKRCAEDQGLFVLAGQYGYRERIAHRRQLKRWTAKWLFSHAIDTLCGYGEKPENTILFSVFLIFSCAIGYFFLGVNYYEKLIKFNVDASLTDNLTTFFLSLYYSVVTFTTLGYGDITPVGLTRFIAVTEAFLGSFTIALFVVVFVKRMSR